MSKKDVRQTMSGAFAKIVSLVSGQRTALVTVDLRKGIAAIACRAYIATAHGQRP